MVLNFLKRYFDRKAFHERTFNQVNKFEINLCTCFKHDFQWHIDTKKKWSRDDSEIDQKQFMVSHINQNYTHHIDLYSVNEPSFVPFNNGKLP